MVTHRHHEWLAEVAQQMQSSFEKAHISAGKPGGAQKAGHHGEEIWARFLRGWLPPQYEIGLRKYILFETELEDGSDTSGETDIIVFHPSYPKQLRDRHEVLMSGVAAAFSCRLTLDREGIQSVVQEAARVKRAAQLRSHDVKGLVLAPFVYGMLAHSHTWNNPTSKPIETITSRLVEFDTKYSSAPREALDLLCVADLNCWSRLIEIMTPPVVAKLPGWRPYIGYQFLNIGHDDSVKDSSGLDLPPIAVLIGLLFEKLSYHDESISALSEGFRVTGTSWYKLSSARKRSNRIFSPEEIIGQEQFLNAFEHGLIGRTMYW
ncbi:DUF6602 domain-containing protein [Nocardia brasiliensis]|uniref:DUF6602 domain-containing protein n=1 Tax=Nocardia brasiliensis TaxID=37326 RepID=UPI002458DBAA|nr:DUF6602 domain-containing protein [Nocardia brasiliensis]